MQVQPPDDPRPPASRPGALTRAELVELVERIMRGDGTEAEQDHLVAVFEQSVTHPGASDLIFWPKGGGEPTAEEVVDAALAHRPIEL